ncbi:MAG: amidotransferase [Smithella sp. SDB]|nr:MAG: amidotransferase [Smithella sp. SDB]
MRAHYLQHVPFEGLGSIVPWLEIAGHTATSTRFFDSEKLPDIKTIDVLIVMGGSMSVNDEDKFPWLISEKKFIYQAVTSAKPVLGICLGAQLIASAVGARVYPSPVKEIGWFPIYGLPSNDHAVFSFPPKAEVFHWHGETFDLPSGSTCLARSDACANQAFQMGNSVIGLQFHLETTPQAALDIVSNCRDELISSPWIQTEKEIMSADPDKYQSINRIMGTVLSYLLGNNR